MSSPDRTARFVQQLTTCQSRVYAYIATLVGDLDQAHDVLQETNLVLWEKSAEYEEGRDFLAWACGVAKYQVLAHRRDRGRDRLRFSDTVTEQLAEETIRESGTAEDRRRALHGCLNKLPARQHDLLLRRYSPDGSVQAIAAQLGRPVGSISQAIYRIRKALAECVERTMRAEGRS
ncbi:MAG: sigma-70 family RNA polymerase sigma factor [Planctomycetes bacterium]|nr:sigma-70 family RNA polymerase sigma factor [Planctomycetota bacterium]